MQVDEQGTKVGLELIIKDDIVTNIQITNSQTKKGNEELQDLLDKYIY